MPQGLEKGDTVDLFSKVMGASLLFEDEPASATFRSWNVRRYELARTARHRDPALVGEFFEDLQAFMALRR